MSVELIGLIGVLVLLVILAIGVPIGIGLGLVGLVGASVILSPEAAITKSGVILFETMMKYELGVLPLFLLMAHVLIAAGASKDFFGAAAKFVGHRRGGLALASIGGCAGFGMISGSSLATAATVGLVAIPEMRRNRYSPALATGAIAAGGTLGSMIPPSGALIVFGVVAQQSIGRMFTAAIIPALTQALCYVAVIAIACTIQPSLGPPAPRVPWKERLVSFRRIVDMVLLIFFVVGGLSIGWFTPTEAAAVGATGSFVIAAARRRLTWVVVREAFHATLATSGMIYAIVVGALVFSVFITLSGLAAATSSMVTDLNAGPVATMFMIAVVLLLLGSILDGLALMLLTTPIFLPIVGSLGLSPIWFGIFLVRAMEIGFVHPPIGMNIYVIKGIAPDVPLGTIFKGVVPFLISDLVHLTLLILFPALALWLPKLLGT